MIKQIFMCLYLNYSQGSRIDYIREFLTIVLIFISIQTGLPTKDQTSDTSERNLYSPFPYIHNSFAATINFFFFVNSLKKPLDN